MQRKLAIIVIAVLVVAGFVMLTHFTFGATSSNRHLGFWIDERSMWSGSGLNWSPQTFVNNYFLTAPYPSGMIFATGPSQIGGFMNTKAQTWLPQVASLADQYTNVQILVLVFINMSDTTQVNEFQSFVNALKGYSSIYGFEYEREYYGNTIAENTAFENIVTGAGFHWIVDPSVEASFPTAPVLDYSTYPYYGGTIPSALPSGARSIGVGYGETGGCPSSTSSCADGMPVVSTYGLWTQSVVTSIVDTSPSAAFTILYSDLGTGTNQYSGVNSLWNNPTLRGWIWSDSYYQSNYALSTSNVCYTCTTSYTQTTSSSSTVPSFSLVSTTTSTTTATSSGIGISSNLAQVEGYCIESYTGACSGTQQVETVNYPSGSYQFSYTPKYCLPSGSDCYAPYNEPEGLATRQWAVGNLTVENTHLEQAFTISATQISSINSTAPIRNILYNGSIVQIVYPANVTSTISISSSHAPSRIYADNRIVRDWGYSQGVIHLSVDPNTVTLVFGSQNPLTAMWLWIETNLLMTLLLALVASVALTVFILRRD